MQHEVRTVVAFDVVDDLLILCRTQRGRNQRLRLTAGEEYGTVRAFESYKNTQIAKSNPNPEAFRKAESFRLWSKFDSSFSGGHALSITPYVRNQDMRFRMHFLPGKPLETNAQKGVGMLSQFNYVINDSLSADIGLDVEYTEGELTQS